MHLFKCMTIAAVLATAAKAGMIGPGYGGISVLDLTYTGTTGTSETTVSFYIPVQSDIHFDFGLIGTVPIVPGCMDAGCGGYTSAYVWIPPAQPSPTGFDYSCVARNVCTGDFSPFRPSSEWISFMPGTYSLSAGIRYNSYSFPGSVSVLLPATNELTVSAYPLSGQILAAAPTSTPEPMSMALLGSGLLLLFLRHCGNQHRAGS